MKTLYISDLDGTLFKSDISISDYSKNVINKLCEKGEYFSVATARTAATCRYLLADIRLQVPIILMNGVCLYDLKRNEYVSVEYFSVKSAEHLINAVKKHGSSGFLFMIDNNSLFTYYENVYSPNAVSFIEERRRKFGKVFTKVDDFNSLDLTKSAYFSVSDRYEKLIGLKEDLERDDDLRIEFYRDIYAEDFWYLEVCSSNASKSGAVKKLKHTYNFDKIIGFGDNLNDIPLFEQCDSSFAVSNARDELKNIADGVIASNDDDAVAKWLEENIL